MNSKITAFSREHNLDIGIMIRNSYYYPEFLSILFKQSQDCFFETNRRSNIIAIYSGDTVCNFCPFEIRSPRLIEKGWGGSTPIFLHPVDIEEFDMPVGSFHVELCSDLGKTIYGRDYLPQHFGTQYFIDSVHEDAMNLVEKIKSQNQLLPLPEDLSLLEQEGDDGNFLRCVAVLGKYLGCFWYYGDPENHDILAPELPVGLTFTANKSTYTTTEYRYITQVPCSINNPTTMVWCMSEDEDMEDFAVDYILRKHKLNG